MAAARGIFNCINTPKIKLFSARAVQKLQTRQLMVCLTCEHSKLSKSSRIFDGKLTSNGGKSVSFALHIGYIIFYPSPNFSRIQNYQPTLTLPDCLSD